MKYDKTNDKIIKHGLGTLDTNYTSPQQMSRIAPVLPLLCALLGAAGCDGQLEQDEPQPSVIRAAVRINPASYYWNNGRATGLDHSLLRAFAERYDKELVVIPVATVRDALDLLAAGDAHIAAGSLTGADELSEEFVASSPYYGLRQQVLYHYSPNALPPDTSALPLGRFEISSHPAHMQTLNQIKRKSNSSETWAVNSELDSHRLIALLNAGLIRYTIADSNELAMSRPSYPYVKVAATLEDEKPVVWLLKKSADTALVGAVNTFFAAIQSDRSLERMIDTQYHPGAALSYPDKVTLIERRDKYLPQYEQYFKDAAKPYGLDWKFIAAISYQESRWNKRATSPTGVKGLMMLTLDTAQKYGLKDRLDPRSSIFAGVKYFHEIKERVRPDTPEPDRTWMALAAYNLGRGHLQDALVLTKKNGGDASVWTDVAKSLDLLQQKKWYDKARHGKPIGGDGTAYVRNVRLYHNLLARLEGDISTDIPEDTDLGDYTPPR